MIKSRFDVQGLSVRLGIAFSRLGISPNAWTIFALVPAALGFVSLYYGSLLLGLIFFIVSGFIDAVDGAVARVTKSVSNLGGFLDGVIDRYVEMALYLGLMVYLWGVSLVLPSQLWIFLLIYGAVMPTYVRAYADHKGVVTDPVKQRKMGGLIERFERLMLLYVGMLSGLVFGNQWLMVAVAFVAVLANFTTVQRIHYVIREAA